MRDRVFLAIMWVVLIVTAAGAFSSMRIVRADLRDLDAELIEDQERILYIRDTYYPDVYLETIPIYSEETETEEERTAEAAPVFPLPEEDIDLMARVVHAEAGNQSMEGKRLVADVILNRMDDRRFPDTVREIIYAPGQFQTVRSGDIDRYIPDITDYGAVLAELYARTNTEVLYFSRNGYISKPVLKEGAHYFSE